MSRLEFAPSSGEIRVDIETGKMEFTTRPGTEFDRGGLRQAIEEAGYAVHSVTVGEPEELEAVPSDDSNGSGETGPWWWPF